MRYRSGEKLYWLLLVAIGLGIQTKAISQEDYALPGFEGAGKLKPEFIKRGKVLYKNHCSGCHGMNGDGKGPGAYGLDPKPRDFTAGIFKFRSTSMMSIPTDRDLERTIREGVPGTSMPSYRLFPDNDIKALAQYIKIFNKTDRWKQRPEELTLSVRPGWVDAEDQWLSRAAAGALLYQSTCSICHGDEGVGDGIGGKALVDNWGNPIKPAHLGKVRDIGSGPAPEDIYKAITTGLAGTPMVSYQAGLNDNQRWELVAFIKYLRLKQSGSDIYLPEVQENQLEEDFENEFE